MATDGAVDQAAKMRRARDLRDASDREAAQTVATTLVPKVITISAKAGTEGKLFGSVTTADVVDAVREQTGVALERRQLDSEPMKTVGQHTVTAKLHSDVSFPITVEIVLGVTTWTGRCPQPRPHATQARVAHSNYRLCP